MKELIFVMCPQRTQFLAWPHRNSQQVNFYHFSSRQPDFLILQMFIFYKFDNIVFFGFECGTEMPF